MQFVENGTTHQESLYTLVEELTTSGEKKPAEKTLKLLKSLCKKSTENLHHVFRLLMTQLEKEHAEIRVSSFQIIDEFFTRSHLFRQLINEEFHHLLELTVEINDDLKLPPPVKAAKFLKSLALARIESWNDKFGSHYKKIELGYNFLKRVKKVDFAGIRSHTELERRRQEELEHKKQQIEKRALENAQNEIELMESEIKTAITQANNCFNLIFPRPEDHPGPDGENPIPQQNNDTNKTGNCEDSGSTSHQQSASLSEDEQTTTIGSEHGIISRSYKLSLQLFPSKIALKESEDNTDVIRSLKDIISEVKLKFLPKVSKWINILSKSSNPQQNLQKLINMKKYLREIIAKYNELTITPMNAQENSEGDEESEDDQFEDVPENDQKYTQEEDLLKDDDLVERTTDNIDNGSDSKPGCSKYTNEEITRKRNLLAKAPIVPFDDDIRHWGEKRKLHVSPFTKSDSLHRFWHHSEFDEEFIPKGLEEALTSRSIVFAGDYKSVEWKCRAPLLNGKLCTRQDRFKCPFHGKIIARDESGNPTNAEDYQREKERKRKLEQEESHQIRKEIEMATGMNLGAGEQQDKKGKKKLNGKSQKMSKLTNLKNIKDTSRKRLENKVLNASALGRVNSVLDSIDKRQSLEKFGSNFNYY